MRGRSQTVQYVLDSLRFDALMGALCGLNDALRVTGGTHPGPLTGVWDAVGLGTCLGTHNHTKEADFCDSKKEADFCDALSRTSRRRCVGVRDYVGA